jgi:predicted phosphohydrolase
MSWTPTIQTKEKIRGQLHVVIQYTDGTITFNEDQWLSSPTTLNDVVASRVAQLSALDTYYNTLIVGSAISTTPTPPATLTQADIDRNTWLLNYRKLVKAKTTLVDTGVITTAQPTYAALLTTVQTGLLASYLDYI